MMPNGTDAQASFSTFETLESGVRSYARSFPALFERAQGSWLYDHHGKAYLDFLAGCSSLNYGHNPPELKQALIDYIADDGLTHSLDMYSGAKKRFLQEFNQTILKPRGLDYVVQFPGPTGANAVEAAVKLARRVTGRSNVIAFTNGFHGCTMGALALTGNRHHRGGAGVPLTGVTRLPFDGYFGGNIDTAAQTDRLLSDPSSGIDEPAAFIVETVQGEGGLNVASARWLRAIEKIARKHGALLIVDDIQAGVGRAGTFFSFEPSGLYPDIVTLAKSISGYGLPMALTLIRRDLDLWKPGEHNGTFRGNCHAFVTARAALESHWRGDGFEASIQRKGELLRRGLEEISKDVDGKVAGIKGRGMMLGLNVNSASISTEIVKECFANGLVIETSGPDDEIVKCLPPLTIDESDLTKGLEILGAAVRKVLGGKLKAAA